MSVLQRLMYIAWKNVFRNKRRTLLTLMILILGSTGLILVGGFFSSLEDRLRETYIYSQTGHVRVNEKGYFEKGSLEPLEYMISNFPEVKEFIEGLPGVRFIAPRMTFDGLVSTDDRSMSVIAVGVDPAMENRMSGQKYRDEFLTGSFVEGGPLSSQDPYGILIGDGLAHALGVKVGDSLSFITTRKEGAIDGADFQVRGIFVVGIKEVGDRVIKMPLATAQKILGVSDQVHSILVFVNSTDQSEDFAKELNAQIQKRGFPLETILWRDQGPLYRQTKDFLDQINRVVQIIISIIFFLSIANTINMALFERMREYGTMMAIGNGQWVIFGVIFFEACFLGLMGSCLGLLFGLGLGAVITGVGIPMPPPPLVSASFNFLKISILWTPKILLDTFLIGFFATVLASFLPAYRASHLRITQALGYV